MEKLVRVGGGLKCGVCAGVLQDAHSLACGHHFCRNCLPPNASSTGCPVCGAPYWAQDVRVNHQLNNIASALNALLSHAHTMHNSMHSKQQAVFTLHSHQEAVRQKLRHHGKIQAQIQDIETRLAVIRRRMASLKPLTEAVQNVTTQDIERLKQKHSIVMSSLRERISKKDMKIAVTGITLAQRDEVQKMCKLMKIEMLTRDFHLCTHLVTAADEECSEDSPESQRESTTRNGIAKRTMKYLFAVAKGSWVVKFDWIAGCLRAKKLIPEDDFEVVGDSSLGRTGAPTRSRLTADRIFEDRVFGFFGTFSPSDPPQEELELLCRLCKGQVSPELDNCELVFARPTFPQQEAQALQQSFPQSKILSLVWLLDCVSAWTMLDVDSYRLDYPHSSTA